MALALATTNGRDMGKAARGKATKLPSKASKGKAAAAVKAERWAHWYTASAVVLSSGLNSYASVVGSGASGAAAGAAAVIGAVIPLLVWQLCKVTAWTYKAGWRRLAVVPGTVAACVLALSVAHVAAALAALTGATPLMSGLLAVGIDCGLGASEGTAILVSAAE